MDGLDSDTVRLLRYVFLFTGRTFRNSMLLSKVEGAFVYNFDHNEKFRGFRFGQDGEPTFLGTKSGKLLHNHSCRLWLCEPELRGTQWHTAGTTYVLLEITSNINRCGFLQIRMHTIFLFRTVVAGWGRPIICLAEVFQVSLYLLLIEYLNL